MRNGNFDGALADFSEVIRLNPWFAPPYYQRAVLRRYKGDYDGALIDAAKLIELAPEEHRWYLERANIYLAKGDFARAIAEYDAALRLTPESEDSYVGRGRAYFFTGDMAKAQADFQTLARLRPMLWTPVLWLGVVEWRAKLPGGLAAAEHHFNMKVWPAPILRMLAGELTPAQALAAADDKNPAQRRRQVCQAQFFAGEIALAQGTHDEAARLFRLAAEQCSPIYIERASAEAELRALDNPSRQTAVPIAPSVSPQRGNPRPCDDGLVARDAFPGDAVCVTPAIHDQAVADNAAASSHTRPEGGCLPGYVWREAGPDDHVCVLPATRQQISLDNRQQCGGDIRCGQGPVRAP
jgi:lipoprotein NlpI